MIYWREGIGVEMQLVVNDVRNETTCQRDCNSLYKAWKSVVAQLRLRILRPRTAVVGLVEDVG